MNNMNKYAVVILYDGKEPGVGVLESVMSVLVNAGITVPELATVIVKDHEGIAGTIVGEVANTFNDEKGALQHALVYLSKRFSREINHPVNSLTEFVIAVTKAVNSHRFAVSQGLNGDSALMNAVEIIANTDLSTITHSTLRGYKLTHEQLESLKTIVKL